MPEGLNPTYFMADMALRMFVITLFQAWIYAVTFAGVGYVALALWHRKQGKR